MRWGYEPTLRECAEMFVSFSVLEMLCWTLYDMGCDIAEWVAGHDLSAGVAVARNVHRVLVGS